MGLTEWREKCVITMPQIAEVEKEVVFSKKKSNVVSKSKALIKTFQKPYRKQERDPTLLTSKSPLTT